MELAPSLHSLHGAGSTEVIAIPIFAQPAPLAGMLAGVLATRVRTVSLTIDSPRVRKKKPAAMAALTPRARTAHDAPSLQRIQPKEKPKRRQQRRRRPKKEEEISERSVQENAPEENRIFRPLVLHHFHSAADSRPTPRTTRRGPGARNTVVFRRSSQAIWRSVTSPARSERWWRSAESPRVCTGLSTAGRRSSSRRSSNWRRRFRTRCCGLTPTSPTVNRYSIVSGRKRMFLEASREIGRAGWLADTPFSPPMR